MNPSRALLDVSSDDAFTKFRQQRWRAGARGIDWQLTFEEWGAIWEASGVFHLRGKKAGQYVMARRGDVGPYSRDNVFICTHAQNVIDAHTGDLSTLGTGRGWTLISGTRQRPYQVVVGHKYIGVYATQSQAEAAYERAVSEIRVSHGTKFCPAEPLNTTQLIGETL